MSLDIGPMMQGWPYEPGKLSVRRVLGEDGREKIQLRLDLGVLQMETEGRPDGRHPHGYESYLDYYKEQLEHYRATHGDDDGFALDIRACERLRTEAMMYYQRYLGEFALDEYRAVVRDTSRNIESLDMCNQYASHEADQMAQERFRPYILMMRARAKTLDALRHDDFAAARDGVCEGLQEIRDYAEWTGRSDEMKASAEVEVLQTLLVEIEGREPVDPVKAVEVALDQAISDERYEDAARFRDQLRVLRSTGGF